MYEIHLQGQRIIVLCRTDLIGNMNTSSTKTKYPFRRILTEGCMEYMEYGCWGKWNWNSDHK